jgi:hypothetical protein
MKVEIRVDGVPPAKNEAKSMAAAVHSQSIRVRALLEAARASTHGLDLPAFPDGQLALDVTVMCPVQPSGDATNYLGGVGDVVQVKGRHGPVDHLRDLAEVAIYTNDSQLQEIHYQWLKHPTTSYRVTIKRREVA